MNPREERHPGTPPKGFERARASRTVDLRDKAQDDPQIYDRDADKGSPW